MKEMQNRTPEEVLAYEQERYLRQVPTLPETKTYMPINHGLMIDVVHEELDKANLTITSKEYNANQDGKIMTFKYGLAGIDIKDLDMGIAFLGQNSVNKAATAKMAGGANVAACTNGCIWGDYTFKRKHTGTIEQDIREFAKQTIGKLEENFEQLVRDKEHMKIISIDKDYVANFLGKAFLYDGLLTSEQLNIVKREMKDSESFPMWQDWLNPDRDNVWNLYNNVTESLKVSHVSHYINKHVKLHDMVKDEWGF